MPYDRRKAALRLFAKLKAGNQETHLGHDDLVVTTRPGYDRTTSAIPRGRWAWGCLRDEQSVRRARGQTLEDVRRRDPGLARSSTGASHLFGSDGAIAVVSFDGRGRLDFRRRVVQTERRAKEQRLVREHGVDHPWLVRQEETRYEGGEAFTEAGPREAANTHPFPMRAPDGDGFVMCNDGCRPYRIRATTPGADDDLTTVGPIGKFDVFGRDRSTPWMRNLATTPLVHAFKPDLYGKEWPLVPTGAETGIAPTSRGRYKMYFPYYRHHALSRRTEEIRYRLNTRPPLRRGNVRARLYAVEWDPERDPATYRTPVRNALRPARWANIDWGTHQSLCTEHWFIVCDSGFVVDSHQFERIDASGVKRRTIGDPEGTSYRGSPPLYTTLWFIPRAELDQRPRSVQAYPVVVDNRPSIHAYADFDDRGGKRVTLWLLGNRFFDASAWIRKGDHLRHTGERVPEEVVGYAVGDVTPHGGNQELHRLEIEPRRAPGEQILTDSLIGGPAGTILAAEPPVGKRRIPALYWVSIGTWPELETVEHAEIWQRFGQYTPLRTGSPVLPAAVYSTRHDSTTIDDAWYAPDPTWLYGAAYAEDSDDPDQGWVMAAGVRSLVKDEPGVGSAGDAVDELYVFDTRDLAAGPAFVIRARDPKNKPLALGYGIHGGWLPQG